MDDVVARQRSRSPRPRRADKAQGLTWVSVSRRPQRPICPQLRPADKVQGSDETNGVGDCVVCHITQLSGEALPEVRAHLSMRISDVKLMMATAARTPARYMRLLLGDRELDDDKTIAEELSPPSAILTLVRCKPESPSLLGIRDDDPLLVPFLIDCNADPNEKEDSGATALHFAACSRFAAVGLALASHEKFAALGTRDMGGMTALHYGAMHGLHSLCDAVGRQLDADVVNARSANGSTALHWAARGGHATSCGVLLSLEHFTAVNCHNSHGWTALHYAAAGGLVVLCRALLAHSLFTAAEELTNNGETALHWAALNGHVEICKMLLDRVNVGAQDVEGMTALDGAKTNKHAAVCELLFARAREETGKKMSHLSQNLDGARTNQHAAVAAEEGK